MQAGLNPWTLKWDDSEAEREYHQKMAQEGNTSILKDGSPPGPKTPPSMRQCPNRSGFGTDANT